MSSSRSPPRAMRQSGGGRCATGSARGRSRRTGTWRPPRARMMWPPLLPGIDVAEPLRHGDGPGEPPVEVTSYRSEGGYADRRRPDAVRFGVTLADDLGAPRLHDQRRRLAADRPRAGDAASSSTRIGGRADLAAGVLRAVGDPTRALRGGRAAPAARGALRGALRAAPRPGDGGRAPRARRGRRHRLGGAGRATSCSACSATPTHPPSRRAARHGATGPARRSLLPELAALRGVPQGKPLPGDALDHSLRTAGRAAGRHDPHLRLAGLLHDLGKATTLADGHFIGHEVVGAELAAAILERLRLPQATRPTHRSPHPAPHVRLRPGLDRCGRAPLRAPRRLDALDDLFALRAADNAASGVVEPAMRRGGRAPASGSRRVATGAALETRQLAIDGNDLQAELDLAPSPEIGRDPGGPSRGDHRGSGAQRASDAARHGARIAGAPD